VLVCNSLRITYLSSSTSIREKPWRGNHFFGVPWSVSHTFDTGTEDGDMVCNAYKDRHDSIGINVKELLRWIKEITAVRG